MSASIPSMPRHAAQHEARALRLGHVARLLTGLFAGLIACTARGASAPEPPAGALAPSERQALLALYARTAGPAWTINTGWGGPSGTECRWYGVRCDERGEHVVSLELSNNGLRGRLPSLQALRRLQVLRVSLNYLQGALPPLAGMRELRVVTAHNNLLTGPLPSLHALPSLERLVVANNALHGPLPSMRGLTRLREFDASNNQLSGIVPRLDGLDRLRRFDVSFNRLQGVASGPSLPPGVDLDGNPMRGLAPAPTTGG
ncbi:hypothetical protein [Oryzisolibacter sp. LB2S]|uniref:hypothetical protein n=1 Tax=Alicycliphilus soli TaxID=3228789 RepID=UPI00345AD670